MSHLLPTNILHTPACEYFSISLIHVRTLSNVSRSVTSYTMIIPWAPSRARKNGRGLLTEIESLTSVVGGCEGAEAFLARGVPDLELDDVVFVLNGLEFEVDANGIEKVLVEGVLSVAQQQTRLAHAAVADYEHFEQIITIQQSHLQVRPQQYKSCSLLVLVHVLHHLPGLRSSCLSLVTS